MNTPTNHDDVIDSRNIIERIEELEGDIASYAEETDPSYVDLMVAAREELTTLQELAAEGATEATDWEYGETLIRFDYFEDYAKELCMDCGYFQSNGTGAVDWNAWPYRCIDWEQVADELKADYTEIDFDGVPYWIRSC